MSQAIPSAAENSNLGPNGLTAGMTRNREHVEQAKNKLDELLRELPNTTSTLVHEQWLRIEINAALEHLKSFTNDVQAAIDRDMELEEQDIADENADLESEDQTSEHDSHNSALNDSEYSDEDEPAEEQVNPDETQTEPLLRGPVAQHGLYRDLYQNLLPEYGLLSQISRLGAAHSVNQAPLLQAGHPHHLQIDSFQNIPAAYPQNGNANVNFDTFDPAIEEEPVFDEMETEDADGQEDHEPEERNPEYEQDMRRIEQENMNVLAQWEDGLGEKVLEKMTCPICRDEDNKIHFLCEKCNQALCINCESKIHEHMQDEELKCPHCRAAQPEGSFHCIRFPRL